MYSRYIGLILIIAWVVLSLCFLKKQLRRESLSYIEKMEDIQEGSPDDYVGIAHYANQYEAEMAKLKLESEDIEVIIAGSPKMETYRSIILGPSITLLVKRADSKQAIDALKDVNE